MTSDRRAARGTSRRLPSTIGRLAPAWTTHSGAHATMKAWAWKVERFDHGAESLPAAETLE